MRIHDSNPRNGSYQNPPGHEERVLALVRKYELEMEKHAECRQHRQGAAKGKKRKKERR